MVNKMRTDFLFWLTAGIYDSTNVPVDWQVEQNISSNPLAKMQIVLDLDE